MILDLGFQPALAAVAVDNQWLSGGKAAAEGLQGQVGAPAFLLTRRNPTPRRTSPAYGDSG